MEFKKDDKVIYLGGKQDKYIPKGAIGVIILVQYDLLCKWDRTNFKNVDEFFCSISEVRKWVDLSIFQELGD